MSSYFGGRKPEDGLIAWQKDALSLYNLTRAVTHPYPGAFTYSRGKAIHLEAYPEDDSWRCTPGKGCLLDLPEGWYGKGVIETPSRPVGR